MKKLIKFITSIIICQLAGIIGSLFTVKSVSTWYLTLNKPSFTPPSWLFAPVWISLYFLMGIALFLVWSSSDSFKKRRPAIILFGTQLIFNTLWSIAFFGLQSPLFGLIIIIALWIFLLLTIVGFLKISKLAGWLLTPYILWVSFAAILNFSLLILN